LDEKRRFAWKVYFCLSERREHFGGQSRVRLAHLARIGVERPRDDDEAVEAQVGELAEPGGRLIRRAHDGKAVDEAVGELPGVCCGQLSVPRLVIVGSELVDPRRVTSERPSAGAPSVAKRARIAVLPRTRSRAAPDPGGPRR
jgi:hypothetical protein